MGHGRQHAFGYPHWQQQSQHAAMMLAACAPNWGSISHSRVLAWDATCNIKHAGCSCFATGSTCLQRLGLVLCTIRHLFICYHALRMKERLSCSAVVQIGGSLACWHVTSRVHMPHTWRTGRIRCVQISAYLFPADAGRLYRPVLCCVLLCLVLCSVLCSVQLRHHN